MNDMQKRQKVLNNYFSKKIMELFRKPISEEVLTEKKISYEEAVEVLEHTISELGKKPILF